MTILKCIISIMSISDNTRNQYLGCLDRMKRDHVDIDDPINIITKYESNGYSNSYIKLHLNAALWYHRHSTSSATEQKINEFSKHIIEYIKKSEKMYINIAKKKKYIEWDEVIKKRREFEKTKGKEKEYLVLCVYSMIVPRRCMDYMKMKYVETKEESTDEDFNYYVKNSANFIFNVFKTKKSMGRQVYPIPKKLETVVLDYIKLKNIKSGQLFFPYKSRSSLANMFHKVFSPDVSVNSIRHSYVNKIFQDTKNMPDLDLIIESAAGMNHSVLTHLKYLSNYKDDK